MTHMRKIIAIVGGTIVIILTLLTSTSLREFFMSPENKINSAIPLSEKLRFSKNAVFESATSTQWKEIEDELDARLKIRALHCAKGYSPAFYVRVEGAKKNLTDHNCFADADNEVAQWLNLRRVGLLLSKSALKPVPALSPSFIVADATIKNASFAGNAGVVMLETQHDFQIVDIETQKPILREAKGAATLGPITANGRLFVTSEVNHLKVRETETGAIVAELPGVRAQEFFWLDDATALYNKADSEKTFIMDFSAGKEVPAQAINKHVKQIVRMSQTTNQFAAFSEKCITKIELVRNLHGLEVKLMDEKHDAAFSTDSLASGISADDNYYFHAGRQITVVSMSTLTAYTAPLESFNAQFAVTTSDPDKILLVAPSQASGDGRRSALYSISKRTTSPLDRSRVAAQRYFYVSALKRHAVISDNKIALMELLPVSKTNALTTAEAAKASAPDGEKPNEKIPENKEKAAAASTSASAVTATPTPAADNTSPSTKAATPSEKPALSPKPEASTPDASPTKPDAAASSPAPASAPTNVTPQASVPAQPAAQPLPTQPQTLPSVPQRKRKRAPLNTV